MIDIPRSGFAIIEIEVPFEAGSLIAHCKRSGSTEGKDISSAAKWISAVITSIFGKDKAFFDECLCDVGIGSRNAAPADPEVGAPIDETYCSICSRFEISSSSNRFSASGYAGSPTSQRPETIVKWSY